MSKRIDLSGLSVFYGKFRAVDDVNMNIEPRAVTAFIGPSGCGKSTLLRTLNRMHELSGTGRIEGKVLLDGTDLYASIFDNVASGLRLNGVRDKKRIGETVEKSLRGANLWNEVSDRLNKAASGLS